MNRAVLYQEKINFVYRGPALAILVLLFVAFAYAGWSGDRWRDARVDSLAEFQLETEHGMSEIREQLAGIEAGTAEVGPFDANPMDVFFPAVLPPASLADFAVGHADLHPASAEISPWSNIAGVFGSYQFDNPTTLSTGSFDVAMVIIVLMPLLMIAISFDVLAGERARSSLAMVLSAPLKQTELVWTRLVFRNVLVWLAAAAAMLLLAFANDIGGDRYTRFGLWLGASFVYALVWLSLIACCVARFRSAMATAGSLVGLWLLFTLAVPATISTLSEALYPTPSRLALLSEVRSAQAETERELAELTEGLLLDHAEQSVDSEEEVPSFYRAAFLANQAARESVRPIVEGFEQARAGRDRTLQWAQYLSPSVVAQRLLMLSAGADLDRQHRFQAQVQAALVELETAVGPAVVSGNRLSLAEFDELKSFEFRDVSVQNIASSAIVPAAFLLVLSFALGVAANRRLAEERL